MSDPIDWLPGEHVAVFGQTGRGKTHLIDRLVRENRLYVVVFKTKHDDEDDGKYWPGFKRIEDVRGMDDPRYTRFLLAPKLGKFPRQYDKQREQGRALVDKVFKQGRWTVVFDELWYCEKKLGLREGIDMLVTQGRSKGISVVMGAQRPVEISRFTISQATHVFAFRGDGRDAKTLGDAVDRSFGPLVTTLTKHDFAYYHQLSLAILRGNSRALTRVIRAVASRLRVPPVD